MPGARAIVGSMSKYEWPREKKWRHLYTRSVKVRRARQLGFEYPRLSDREKLETETLNVLFVCSMNKWRSPTAERVYKNHPLLNVRSVGTSSKARRTITVADVRWSDLIIFMEKKHRELAEAKYRSETAHREMHVLGLEDRFKFMDPELIAKVHELIDPILRVESP